jgi:hypothetical protein
VPTGGFTLYEHLPADNKASEHFAFPTGGDMVETMERSETVLNLDDRELQERINLLKRLRKMLEIQRDKFREYLSVLEKQERSIVDGDTRALEAQAVTEQQIIREIMSVQKVVKPLDEMYQRAYPRRKEEITRLQGSLDKLREQVLQRNEQNRILLSRQRDELKKKIEALRIPKGRKSVYGRDTGPSMIDISC